MHTIQDRILSITRELAKDDQITPETPLLDEGIIDSLTTIELIAALETQFSVTIGTEDLNHHNFNTVENITTLISEKLK